MNDLLDLQKQAMRLGWSMFEAQAAAWTVIGLRMPGLAASAGKSGPPPVETRRMVSEKISATQMGMMAGSLSAARLGAASNRGPVALASAMLDVFEAAALPAQKRVLANVKRLSRKSLLGG